MNLENYSDSTPVTQYLDRMKIPYRFFKHPGQVNSLEQAAEERGQRSEQIIRSILFRINKGEYLMVLVAGPHQISWPALRQYVGQSRLTMARREEVLQVTGYELGAVSPLGLTSEMRILADPGIFEEEEISIGSGIRNSTVILKQANLKKALPEIEIVSLVVE